MKQISELEEKTIRGLFKNVSKSMHKRSKASHLTANLFSSWPVDIHLETT